MYQFKALSVISFIVKLSLYQALYVSNHLTKFTLSIFHHRLHAATITTVEPIAATSTLIKNGVDSYCTDAEQAFPQSPTINDLFHKVEHIYNLQSSLPSSIAVKQSGGYSNLNVRDDIYLYLYESLTDDNNKNNDENPEVEVDEDTHI